VNVGNDSDEIRCLVLKQIPALCVLFISRILDLIFMSDLRSEAVFLRDGLSTFLKLTACSNFHLGQE
jgi:hypothetical protein